MMVNFSHYCFKLLGLEFDHWYLSRQNHFELVELHSPFSKMDGGYWMQLELEMISEPNFQKFKGICLSLFFLVQNTIYALQKCYDMHWPG